MVHQVLIQAGDKMLWEQKLIKRLSIKNLQQVNTNQIVLNKRMQKVKHLHRKEITKEKTIQTVVEMMTKIVAMMLLK